MISSIFSAIKKVWGEDEEEELDHREDGTECHDITPETSVDRTVTDDPRSTTSKISDHSPNRKTFNGTVTSVHSSYGLVDHTVYFDLKLCKTFAIPKVGTAVSVTAERKDGDSGWCAVSIGLNTDDDKGKGEDWDSDPDDSIGASASVKPKTTTTTTIAGCAYTIEDVVTMVKVVTRTTVYMNENLTCDTSVIVREGDYKPFKGDWVTANIRVDNHTGNRTVMQIKPLRVMEFTGEVNSAQSGFGYINRDIYYRDDILKEGYRPRRREKVRGKAVECSQGSASWRAIEVLPDYTQKTPAQSPSQKSNMSPMSPMSQTKALLADKEDVVVSPSLQFGDVAYGEVKRIKAFIRNEGSQTQTLLKCKFLGRDDQFHVESIDFVPPNRSMDPNMAVLIPPDKVAVVTLMCNASNLGMDQKLLMFEFKTFKIGRYVNVTVRDSSHRDCLEPNTPYRRKTMTEPMTESNSDWTVPGQRPARSKIAIRLPNKLPQFPVPKVLDDAYRNGDDLAFVASVLTEPLDLDNYTERFSTLLHLEEIQEEIDIRQYDLHRVSLREVGEYLALAVPGLAEGRPSVLVGDSVVLSSPGLYDQEPDYQGYVHEVLKSEVLLKFHNEFHNKYGGEDYNVRFTLNRTTKRRCQQAVNFAPSLGPEVLFPTRLIPKVPQTKASHHPSDHQNLLGRVDQGSSPMFGIKRGPRRRHDSHTSKLEFFNRHLNGQQKAAVRRILSGQSRPTPYILFGPPGTGKTVTLVEALLQVITQLPHSRIIACTPSNSAADLLCERLHLSGKVKASDMVRLNSYSREEESIPVQVRPYCKTGDDLELVSRHRLLISTCTSAGMMYSLGLKTGHFTHVFIDEAGQATEPEAMIPLGLVSGTDGQIVLAGDPLQLGPVLQSHIAKELGLGLSYLERLIGLSIYERNEAKFADHGSYDPLLVTKLIENYRSHEALLKLPSMLFYHNELVPSADPAIINAFCQWDELPQKNFPLIFHGIRGEDMREGNSPSWFNPMEVIQVMRYLTAISDKTETTEMSFNDIGIITPYRKQVEKIRLMINKLGKDKVKVGSVEEFQGQERRVMIISTVRSSEKQVRVDVHHNLGFLSNPKRYNVAISRAQSLMVIIGNPHLLAQDEHWKTLIAYCIKNGGYVGCDPPDLTLPEDIDLEPYKRRSHIRESQEDVSAQHEEEVKTMTPGVKELGVADKCDDPVMSESDGDETLSVNSADTEIYCVQPSVFPAPTEKNSDCGAEIVQITHDKPSEATAVRGDKQDLCCPTEHPDVLSGATQSSLTSESVPRGSDAVDSHILMNSSTMRNPNSSKPHQCTSQLEATSRKKDKSAEISSPLCEYASHGSRSPSTPECSLSSASMLPQRPHRRKNTAERLIQSLSNLQSPVNQPVSDNHRSSASSSTGSWDVTQVDGSAPTESPNKCDLDDLHAEPKVIEVKVKDKFDLHVVEYSQAGLKLVEALKVNEKRKTPERSSFCDTNQTSPVVERENSDSKSAVHTPDTYSAADLEMTDDPEMTDSLDDLVSSCALSVDDQQDENANCDVNAAEVSYNSSQLLEQPQCNANAPYDIQNARGENVWRSTLFSALSSMDEASTEEEQSAETMSEHWSGTSTDTEHVNKVSTDNLCKALFKMDQAAQHFPPSHYAPCGQTDNSSKQADFGGLKPANQETVSDYTQSKARVTVSAELERQIIRQVEYYLGDMNLPTDTYFIEEIQKHRGWIPLRAIVKCRQLAKLSTDIDVIMSALKKSRSGLLEVDREHKRVRRSLLRPVPKDYKAWKQSVKARAVLMVGLRSQETKSHLMQGISGRVWGGETINVEHIKKLRIQKKCKAGGKMLITYPFVAVLGTACQARVLAAETRGIPFRDSRLHAYIREDILDLLFDNDQQKQEKISQYNYAQLKGNWGDWSTTMVEKQPGHHRTRSASNTQQAKRAERASRHRPDNLQENTNEQFYNQHLGVKSMGSHLHNRENANYLYSKSSRGHFAHDSSSNVQLRAAEWPHDVSKLSISADMNANPQEQFAGTEPLNNNLNNTKQCDRNTSGSYQKVTSREETTQENQPISIEEAMVDHRLKNFFAGVDYDNTVGDRSEYYEEIEAMHEPSPRSPGVEKHGTRSDQGVDVDWSLYDLERPLYDLEGSGYDLHNKPVFDLKHIPDEPPSDLELKIIRQVEFYFGNYNLPHDSFMLKSMDKNNGWMAFDLLLSFPRLRKLTTDLHIIVKALLKSESGLLEIDLARSRLRRSPCKPLPEDMESWKQSLRERSVFVIELKTKQDVDDLINIMSPFGKVEHIRQLTQQSREKEIDGQMQTVVTYPFVVVFEDVISARRLVNKKYVDFGISRLYPHLKKDILRILFDDVKKKKHIGKNKSPPSVTYPQLNQCPPGWVREDVQAGNQQNNDENFKQAIDDTSEGRLNWPVFGYDDVSQAESVPLSSCYDNSYGGESSGALLLSDADGLHAIPQPQREPRDQMKGRGIKRILQQKSRGRGFAALKSQEVAGSESNDDGATKYFPQDDISDGQNWYTYEPKYGRGDMFSPSGQNTEVSSHLGGQKVNEFLVDPSGFVQLSTTGDKNESQSAETSWSRSNFSSRSRSNQVMTFRSSNALHVDSSPPGPIHTAHIPPSTPPHVSSHHCQTTSSSSTIGRGRGQASSSLPAMAVIPGQFYAQRSLHSQDLDYLDQEDSDVVIESSEEEETEDV